MACDSGDPGPADGALDGGSDGASDGALDVSFETCTTADDCNDWRFCNGTELCDPTDARADERGCVPAYQSSYPCAGPCNEDPPSCGEM